MTCVNSPLYNDKNVMILYRTVDLLWRPAGQVLRFVIVVHPTRGQCILMTTDLSLEPIEVIRLYRLRFKIEVSFKQAVHTIGTCYYHFWMTDMAPLKRNQGNQYLHKKSELYRAHVKRKIHAYHCFVQAGIIAYMDVGKGREQGAEALLKDCFNIWLVLSLNRFGTLLAHGCGPLGQECLLLSTLPLWRLEIPILNFSWLLIMS